MAATGSITGCGSGIITPHFQSSHILMLGDWGQSGSYTEQSNVAKAMQSYSANRDFRVDSLLMLGDNFYGDLTGGAASPRWQTQFEQMYPASVFDGPVYAVPGNHDYEVWPMAKYPEELAYAKKPGTRWTMPAQWYKFEFPSVDPLVTFFALDSNMPVAADESTSGSFYTMTEEQRQQQLAWLTAELEKPSKTTFVAVMAHHPVYSDGPHGDHPILINDWDPLLRKHNVHLYLAGHDHDLQHLEFENHPTSFFLSGGGGAGLYNLATDPAVRGPWAQSVHGFSHLEVRKEWITLRHLDNTGSVLHAFRKYPDGGVEILTR